MDELDYWFSVHDRIAALALNSHLDGEGVSECREALMETWKRWAGGTPARRTRVVHGVTQRVEVYPALFIRRADDCITEAANARLEYLSRQQDLPFMGATDCASDAGEKEPTARMIRLP